MCWRSSGGATCQHTSTVIMTTWGGGGQGARACTADSISPRVHRQLACTHLRPGLSGHRERGRQAGGRAHTKRLSGPTTRDSSNSAPDKVPDKARAQVAHTARVDALVLSMALLACSHQISFQVCWMLRAILMQNAYAHGAQKG